MEIPSFKRIGAVPAKLVRRTRTKGAIVVLCAVVLVAGIWLAPPRITENPSPPKEKVAPMIEAEVERRAQARLFRGLYEAGLQALPRVVAFHLTPSVIGRMRLLDDSLPIPGRPVVSGCGLLVAASGVVLTHVNALGNEPRPLCMTHDGSLVPAGVVAREAATGLVLLQTALIDVDARFQDGKLPASDDIAIAVARRGASPHIVPVLFGTDCVEQCAGMSLGGDVEPGMPVFDLSGSALAMIGGNATDVIAYGVPDAMRRLQSLIAEEHAFPSSLGLVFQAMSGALAERLGEGALINGVEPDGPADHAGLRAGDVVTSIGSEPVRSAEDALPLIVGARPGTLLTIVFRRKNRDQTVEAIPQPSTLGISRSDASETPLADAPKACDVFSATALSAADVDGETRVLSIEHARVRGPVSARRIIARRQAPWLVHLQQGGERFFALLGEAH
ncbi:MAG: serine protease [Vicinamibacteria bacterium]|nr:serine protease [Vicinamibacteria bacterium]